MKKHKKIWFPGLLFLFLLCQPLVVQAADHATPNVVIFLADDQGWGDLSLHGNKDLSTPNIDSLAKDGVSFDRFYVCAVCAPTRAEFLTGRYHPRTGVHGVSRGAERMNLDEKTVADAFQAAGYATGCFGKWHNGMQYPYHPRGRGFDTFVGYCSGHWGDYFDAELERDGVYFKSEGYITDVVTNEAIEFIEKQARQDKPFFCYVPLPTPHSPMQVPDKYWDRHREKPFKMEFPGKNEHTRAAFAMVENIDDNVGRVLETLDKLKLADDTIVIYFSDNGPNGRRWNGGMKGRKGSVDEGGVRTAMFMRWPGRIWKAHEVKHLSGAIDLLPTLVDLAGIERVGDKPIDGVSMKPFLFGLEAKALATQLDDRLIFSNQNGRVSVRSKGFRLDQKGKLYDMVKDPGQSEDVSPGFAKEAGSLRKAVKTWRQDVGLNTERKDRPFIVGHEDWPLTELPARDATTIGKIKRSSIHPNCSYFFNWTSKDDQIQWDVEVLEPGHYEAIVYYTCPKEDVGSTIMLKFQGRTLHATVKEAHDPPIEGEKENRIYMRESFTKDFKPMSMGRLWLGKGANPLRLQATKIPGSQAMEFRRLILKRVSD